MKKIAVIGFGFMGVVHAKNIINSGILELCGIVDNRPGDIFAGLDKTGNQGALDLPLERLRQTPVFKTLEECVDKVQPDAVVICVPLLLHYELTKKALNLGLDVLLEKPFCPEAGQCRELIKLAEEKTRILMVAHCIRFAPQYEFLAQCIRDERYGKLRWLTTSRMGGEPTWGVWQNPEIKKTCGGSLLDLLIHDLDFVNYCFNAPADVKVNLHYDEYWEVALEYNHEAAISIKGGFLHRNTAFAAEYAATFERGSLRFCTLKPDVVHVGTDDGAQAVTVSGDGYYEEMKHFAECIASRISPQRCPPESSLQAIELFHVIRSKSE